MSWDSDEIDIDAVIAAKTASVKKDELEIKEEKVILAAFTNTAVSQSKAGPAKTAAVSTGPQVDTRTRVYDQDDVPESDPYLERLRLERLQMKSDNVVMDDLFSGCDRPEDSHGAGGSSKLVREVIHTIKEDSFESLKLLTSRDIEVLASRCSSKLLSSEVKSGSVTFMRDIIKTVGMTVSVNELNQLIKIMKDLIIIKNREMSDKMSNKKKLSSDVSQIKKGAKIDVNSAMGEMYGDGNDDEYYDEDY